MSQSRIWTISRFGQNCSWRPSNPPEGAQHLSHWYWELLVDLTISLPWLLQDRPAYSPRITEFLTGAQEWSKLEYWIGIVWMLWPPGAGGMTREDVEDSTRLLFRQRPGAIQKLEQWMERWSRGPVNHIPDSFRLVCEQARGAARQDTPYVRFCAHHVCSGSHAGFRFFLGRFHPLTKELKDSLLHHRPSPRGNKF
jgi:hypothetical protein